MANEAQFKDGRLISSRVADKICAPDEPKAIDAILRTPQGHGPPVIGQASGPR